MGNINKIINKRKNECTADATVLVLREHIQIDAPVITDRVASEWNEADFQTKCWSHTEKKRINDKNQKCKYI